MKLIVKCIILTLIITNSIYSQQEASRVITLFIENYPNKQNNFFDDYQARQLCDTINCYNLNIRPNIGIFSTYMGYLAISDDIGQITFPRKTIKKSINLLITPKIYPVFMFQNTIAYWEIPKDVSAKLYKIDKKKDKDTKLYYWNVTTKEIGSKRRVPLHTIVVFADPNYIYVPQGITLSTKSSQLILPTIFAKKDPNYTRNILFILTIKPFFSKLNKLFNERPLGYAMHITD